MGIGMTGNFYRQRYLIPQGHSVKDCPDIYVIVINTGRGRGYFKMNIEAPTGVNIILPEYYFYLRGGENRNLPIGVEVAEDVIPGDYNLTILAVSGIIGAAMSAKLTVVSEAEAANVLIDTVPPLTVSVYRFLDSGAKNQVAYSEDGALEVVLAPGLYAAVAYAADGTEAAREDFELDAGQSKMITLRGRVARLENFKVSHYWFPQTQTIRYANVVGNVVNIFKPLENAELILLVTLNGNEIERYSLATWPSLKVGRTGVNKIYTPSEGWRVGNYGYTLLLNVDGIPVAASEEIQRTIANVPTSTIISCEFKAANLPPGTVTWSVIWVTNEGAFELNYTTLEVVLFSLIPSRGTFYVDAYDNLNKPLTDERSWGEFSLENGKRYIADFSTKTISSIPLYKLDLDIKGKGSILPEEIARSYLEGTVIELTAYSAIDWRFHSWEGSDDNTANPTTVTMDSDRHVVCNFTQEAPEEGGDPLDTFIRTMEGIRPKCPIGAIETTWTGFTEKVIEMTPAIKIL